MRSVKTYLFQFSLVASVLIVAIFGAYRYWGEYPRELAAVEAHQKRELESLRQALDQDKQRLLANVQDWAHWDDTYEFVQAPASHESYVKGNIVKGTFLVFNLVGIGYYDKDLNKVLQWGFDVGNEQFVPFEQVLPRELSELIGTGEDVDPGGSVTGWVRTNQGPAEFAIEPITNSDETSAPAGYLLFARLVSRDQLDALQAITRLTIDMRPVEQGDAITAIPLLENKELVEGVQTKRQRLLTDPSGAPVAVLSIEHDPIAMPKAIGPAQIFLLGGLLMVPVLVLTVTERTLVRPLRRNVLRIESMVRDETLELLPEVIPIIELEQIRGAFNRLVRQAQNQQAHLTELSMTDALTGIPNRRSFDWTANGRWRQAMRLRQPFLFVLIDLDYFKGYNDEKGHAEGDRALWNIAQILMKFSRRSGDFCARLGGEEFVAVVLGLSESDARSWVEELRLAIEQLGISHPRSQVSAVLTVSMGAVYIASPDGDDVITPLSDIIRQADLALYVAKKEGRNRITFRILELDSLVHQ
ncbi:diguanylate cyclase [Marinobacter halodurans]|uniref:diguanylate cyclase n=1 Tax=Marinobacter halodurans TaxID=2528979 RepID=A0ABY1ZRJ7_9GAMM|nr:diguanylate cyclase [Marinobacter halodurans]TBW57587.1 diguanylate cyclase [Marinobacter halodurans]